MILVHGLWTPAAVFSLHSHWLQRRGYRTRRFGYPSVRSTLSQNALVGSWNVNAGGTSCQMFLTLTSYGGGSRGGTRGCPGNLADLRIWKVAGSQLVLSDPDGTQIATLYSSGNERFDGQTSTGTRISLTR